MATLQITLDTDSNEMSVSINGTAIDSVSDLCISNYGYGGKNDYNFYVTTSAWQGDVNVVTRLCASDSPTAKEAVATAKAAEIAGFVRIPAKTKAVESLSKILRG